jgi:hypothetical protein
MRKSARATFLALLTFLAAVAIGLVSTLTAAVTLAATALIVPGTGTHNIETVMGYKENARDRYITPADPACTAAGCTLVGIPYPASFWPIPLPGWCPNLSCDTWNESVGTGVTNLDTTLTPYKNPTSTEQVVIFGYSQGGAVVSHEMYNLASLDPAVKDRFTVVTIGNIENPQGLWSRLSFLPTIPILNVTFGPQLPTNIGIKSINYSFEYDPVGDAPLYWGNPLAMLNALAAFEYVHGYYLDPNSNAPTDSLPYGYNDTTLATAIQNAPHRTYQDATFVLIPQQGTLPIMQPFMDIASATGTTALVKPFVDLFSPLTKVLIDLGYNRIANPGIPQMLSILPFNPFQNWVDVGVKLVVAGVQGVQAFLGDLGVGTTMIAPAVPDPTSTLTVSTLAARSGPADTSNTLTAADTTKQTTTATRQDNVVQKGDETVVAKTGAEAVEKTGANTTQTTATETKPSKTDDPPVTKLDDTTKQEETAKPEEKKTSEETKKDNTKKDSSNGSVSLKFSPKPSTPGQTSGATDGQSTTTTTTDTTSSTGTSSEQAAA